MSDNKLLNVTPTEENYLKTILKHAEIAEPVSTTTLAESLATTPASVTDMIRKLKNKGFITYIKYKGVWLTPEGKAEALQIIRRHRLWELFLVKVLDFSWEEVHEAADQLEHVRNVKLVNKIDEHLGYPSFDPHGDPIPDAEGNVTNRKLTPLTSVPKGIKVKIAAVLTHTTDFLIYLNRLNLQLDTEIIVKDIIDFDDSRVIQIGSDEPIISYSVACNILVYDFN